jgi:hypothetical protein
MKPGGESNIGVSGREESAPRRAIISLIGESGTGVSGRGGSGRGLFAPLPSPNRYTISLKIAILWLEGEVGGGEGGGEGD